MKQDSTTFLKGVIYILGLAGLALCVLAFPTAIGSTYAANYRPILSGMYASAIPFFIILYKGLKLLSCIDKNTAFSQESVAALKHIKYAALTITLLYALDLPFIYIIDHQAGLRGRMLLGLVLTCAPFVVSVFAAVLEKLLQNGMEIKSENDLTV